MDILKQVYRKIHILDIYCCNSQKLKIKVPPPGLTFLKSAVIFFFYFGHYKE